MAKWSRILLTVMALLDAVCLGRFLDSISLAYLCRQIPLFLTILWSIHIVFVLSLAVSAYGLAMGRKWALWLSYAQFPARAIRITLSFGWLTLAARFLGHEAYRPLVFVAIGLEFVRLAATIVIHRRMKVHTS